MNWSAPYRETRFDGKIFQVRKAKCTCDCHNPGMAIMHFMDCCQSGWIYQRKLVQPLGTRRKSFQFIVPRSFGEAIAKYPKIKYIHI